MSPFEHGEVFVTDDGAETDLDLGHYERFTHAKLSRDNNWTTGRLYRSSPKSGAAITWARPPKRSSTVHGCITAASARNFANSPKPSKTSAGHCASIDATSMDRKPRRSGRFLSFRSCCEDWPEKRRVYRTRVIARRDA